MLGESNELWSWAHEDDAPDLAPEGAERVVAILVAHNAGEWLESSLDALAALNQRPGWIIGVDAGSYDKTSDILREYVKNGVLDEFASSAGDDGFGTAVNIALKKVNFNDEDWLWLLHDDVQPKPSALDELLRAAQNPPEGEPDADVLVPKLLNPKLRNRPDTVSEIGQSISSTGTRVFTPEAGDIDQAHAEPRRVLGGSTAGLFISARVWRELDGMNPQVRLFRDGVEFGWRANQAGFVVRTAPAAALYHQRTGRLSIRDSVVAENADVLDLVNGMQLVTAYSSNPKRTRLWLNLASLGKAAGLVLGKSLSGAKDQLAARKLYLAANPLQVDVPVNAQSVDELRPGKTWGIRHLADQIGTAVGDSFRDVFDAEPEASIDELTSDDYVGRSFHTRLISPASVGFVVALFGTLLAARGLLGIGPLVSDQLFAAPGSISQAWSNWAESIAGLTGSNAPWIGMLALASTVTLAPNHLAALLVLGGPALAAWSAHAFLRKIISGHRWITAALAGFWGLLLPVLSATALGSMDLAIAAIALPRLAASVVRWNAGGTSGAEALRAPGAVAFWLTVLSVCFPLIWVLALPLIFVVSRNRDVTGGIIAAVGPLFVMLTWLPRLFSEPGRWLTGIDPTAVVAGNPVPTVLAIFGVSRDSTTPIPLAVGVFLVVFLLGLVSLIVLPEKSEIVWLMLGGILAGGVVLAALVSRFVITIAGIPVRPDGKIWVLIAAWAALLLLAKTLDQKSEAQYASKIVTLVIVLGLLSSGAWWLIGGAGQPLRHESSQLPSYVRGVQDSPRATRTLLVEIRGGFADYSLVSSTTPTWGTGESTPVLGVGQPDLAVAEAAQQISQGQSSEELAEQLHRLAIGHVWVKNAGTEVLTNLERVPGVSVAASAENEVVITVGDLPSRLMIRDGNFESSVPDLLVTSASHPRELVLSEPIDSSWIVRVGGHRLSRVDSADWRATFELPADVAGEITWGSRIDWFGVGLQTLAWLTLVVLAAPTARQQSNHPKRAMIQPAKRGRS